MVDPQREGENLARKEAKGEKSSGRKRKGGGGKENISEAIGNYRRDGGEEQSWQLVTGSTVQMLLISLIRMRGSLRPHETVCGSLSTSETDGARPYKYRASVSRMHIAGFPAATLSFSILVFLE